MFENCRVEEKEFEVLQVNMQLTPKTVREETAPMFCGKILGISKYAQVILITDSNPGWLSATRPVGAGARQESYRCRRLSARPAYAGNSPRPFWE